MVNLYSNIYWKLKMNISFPLYNEYNVYSINTYILLHIEIHVSIGNIRYWRWKTLFNKEMVSPKFWKSWIETDLIFNI